MSNLNRSTRVPDALALAILVLLALLVSACSLGDTGNTAPAATSNPSVESTYLTTQMAVFAPGSVHPGDQVTVEVRLTYIYQPQVSMHQDTYVVALYGPFPSLGVLQSDIANGIDGPPEWRNLLPESATTLSDQGNSLAPSTWQKSLSLPESLTPGLYDLVAMVSEVGSRATARSDAPLQVIS